MIEKEEQNVFESFDALPGPPYLIGKFFMGGVQWQFLYTREEFDEEWGTTKKSAIGYEKREDQYVEIEAWSMTFISMLPMIRKSLEKRQYMDYAVGDQGYVKFMETLPGVGYIQSAVHASDGDKDRAKRAAASSTGSTITTGGCVAGAAIGTVLLPGLGSVVGALIGGAVGGASGAVVKKAVNESINDQEIRDKAGSLKDITANELLKEATVGAVFGSMSGVVCSTAGGFLGKTAATTYVAEKTGSIVVDSFQEEMKESIDDEKIGVGWGDQIEFAVEEEDFNIEQAR